MTNIRKAIDIDEVKAFIQECSPTTKVYIGCDSSRFRIDGVWHAEYYTVVVAHIDGCRGCKIFGEITRERDYDQRKDRPAMRMMTEVQKAAELYNKLVDSFEYIYEKSTGEIVVGVRPVEIHIDINPSEMHGSSCVLNQAIGYIKGMCGVVPMIKPLAWGASYAADRYAEIARSERDKEEAA